MIRDVCPSRAHIPMADGHAVLSRHSKEEVCCASTVSFDSGGCNVDILFSLKEPERTRSMSRPLLSSSKFSVFSWQYKDEEIFHESRL